MNLEQKIEALLFYKNGDVSVKELSNITKKSEAEIQEALASLAESTRERGIVVLQTDDKVRLGTHPEMSSTIEELIKEELNKDLGKAGLETLSIILYYGPVSRSEIDYIRGVNSSFIIRNLMVRGLVERMQKDSRSYLYKPSLNLLAHLGVSKVEELPDYESVKGELDNFNKTEEQEEENDQ